MNILDGRPHVENKVQGLRQDNAVEPVFGKRSRIGEVADDGCARIAVVDVQYVLADDAISAEASGIIVFLDLKHITPNV